MLLCSFSTNKQLRVLQIRITNIVLGELAKIHTTFLQVKLRFGRPDNKQNRCGTEEECDELHFKRGSSLLCRVCAFKVFFFFK